MFVIQKITQRYHLEQDRISFSVQNTEQQVLLLWLTQRLANRLVSILVSWKETIALDTFGGRIHVEWDTTFALLDRLLHHAYIVPIAGESYRLKHQRQAGMMHSIVC